MVRTSAGRQTEASSYASELRTLLKAVKMADGSCTVIPDYERFVSTAQQGKTPERCKALWAELYAAASGKDITFEWRKRNQTLGQRLAHQFARDAAKARS